MPASAPPPYRQRVIEQVRDVPDEFLPALLQMVSAFRESVALGTAAESLERGWAEAQGGDTRSVSELWDGLSDA